MVIIGLITTGIVLMLIVMAGITNKKGTRGPGFKGSSENNKELQKYGRKTSQKSKEYQRR